MLHRKVKLSNAGYSLPELIVVIVVVGLISAALMTFISHSVQDYYNLQQQGTLFGELATQSQRVAAVLRGLTDVTEATSDDITIYAYFSPQDATVSIIHYYKNAAGNVFYADVTPMTANPPTGVPIPSKLKTYTIISNLYKSSNVQTFVYLDSLSNQLAMPLSDLHAIKAIQINLAIPESRPSASGNEAITLQVSLRNRKTNL